MAAPNQPPSSVVQLSFSGGMASHVDPVQIGEKRYRASYNMLNRGGFLSTRPGNRWVTTFQKPSDGHFSRAQGLCHFKTLEGSDHLLVAIDGAIYHSPYPFENFTALPLRLREDAPEVWFAVCEQSVKTNEDGSISLIDPKRVVVIQDGLSTPIVWDGGEATQDYDIPQGTCMAFSGNRLWVASGAELYASDIGDPTAFDETTYIGVGGSFLFPLRITAVAELASEGNLVVWTSGSMHTVMSSVRDRSTWRSIPNFMQVVSPTIGCVGQRSVTQQYGNLWWMSRDGLMSYDYATATRITSKLFLMDSEMAVSKEHLPRDLSGVALGWFGNFLMVSVPYGGFLNRHTWVMDGTPMESVSSTTGSSPVWSSIWTGTNPSAWVCGMIGGGTRCYHLSADEDGRCSVWESFSDLPDDSGVPISWAVETRGFTIDGFSRYEVRTADFRFGKVRGDLDLAVFIAPSQHGQYTKILTHSAHAEVAPYDTTTVFTEGSTMFRGEAAGQFREFRTQQPRSSFTLPCDPTKIEGSPGRDSSFSFLVAGVGKCNLTGMRVITLPDSENHDGRCTDADGPELRALHDGTISSGPWPDLEFTMPMYASVQNATVHGSTEKVYYTALSCVSQAAADRIASKAAESIALQKYLAKVTVHPMPPSCIV